MGETTKHFPIAVAPTMSRGVFAYRPSGFLWRTLSGILWCRLLLLLLAALRVTTLANICTRTRSELPSGFCDRGIAASSDIASVASEPQGESDV
jgi:hypothetical protein